MYIYLFISTTDDERARRWAELDFGTFGVSVESQVADIAIT